MLSSLKPECSFSSWYPLFKKDSLRATKLDIPDEILKYLEHDAFLLPLEATNDAPPSPGWTDDFSSEADKDCEYQPTFPEFSKKVQDVIDEYGAVFIKSNWSAPLDATWVAPTKTLKCNSLEDVYLLLKSSDRITKDLTAIKHLASNGYPLKFSLILKQWTDINPCTEFRCFVVDKELIGISQRDISQYYTYNESEKFNISTDIKSLFLERIRDRFSLSDYSFDVIRLKKDKVKIMDFGPMDESATKGTLFTLQELQNPITDMPEFRFIGEEVGIQPKSNMHVCVPLEINEFFQTSRDSSALDMIQREVENQEDEQNRSSKYSI
ncbi:translation initiation factor eIF2 assembly protein-like isoform X1 [Prorops nasuta]|uniref:translation initiation factor eIF2 assembly protein-like isoform X1 n=1 Tax=Prorops nasuta TaxID=863751 RepID=UPI0034CF3B5D